MERFIHDQNLAHYRRLLADANVAVDEVRHRLLLKLLSDEEAKEKSLFQDGSSVPKL